MADSKTHRRTVLGALGAMSLGVAVGAQAKPAQSVIPQSICRWCYSQIPLDRLCREAKRIGYRSIELLGFEECLEVKKHGLTCAMIRCGSIADGLNRKENHDKIVQELTRNIEFAASEGFPNVICMSGNRRGLDDQQGLENCVVGLKRIVGLAEKKKVTICMEGLNSRVDHKDYMYDRTSWGVDLCKKLGSDRFKLLYDIYHMQIMEGDIIRTIRDNKEYIGHYHTGGCPGRNEINDTQELNYPAIVKAIVETGYKGFLGQEFIPKKNPIASLEQAFTTCAG